jgi:hypothetical protein
MQLGQLSRSPEMKSVSRRKKAEAQFFFKSFEVR